MDDISTAFPSYPLHNPYEVSGQLLEMPAHNVFHSPIAPHHPGAPPAAPISSRNSTSQVLHASLAPLQPAARSKSSEDATRPLRKRITRACDQCNQLRTKCDGQQPCTHCTDLEMKCQYNREQKKRGKASRKEFAQRVAAKDSYNRTGKLGSTDAAATKVEKSEALSFRLARQATPSPLTPPSFTTDARLTPTEGIPAASVLPNSRDKPGYCCFDHMQANNMDGGNWIAPAYDGVQLNESSDVTGSETNFNTCTGQFDYHHGFGSEALANGQNITPRAGQPGSAQFQGVKKFGEEPVSTDNYAFNRQNAIPSSQGPHFLSSSPAATFGYTYMRCPNFEPTVPTPHLG